jgi:hypothetical protein
VTRFGGARDLLVSKCMSEAFDFDLIRQFGNGRERSELGPVTLCDLYYWIGSAIPNYRNSSSNYTGPSFWILWLLPRMSLTEGFGPCDSRHEAGTEVRGMVPPAMILGEGSLQ